MRRRGSCVLYTKRGSPLGLSETQKLGGLMDELKLKLLPERAFSVT